MEKGETSYGDLVTMEFYLAKIAQFHRGKNVDVRWGRLKKAISVSRNFIQSIFA